jgi:hypothetical protein
VGARPGQRQRVPSAGQEHPGLYAVDLWRRGGDGTQRVDRMRNLWGEHADQVAGRVGGVRRVSV